MGGEEEEDSIEARIERIRRLHGWTSDTNQVSAVDIDDRGKVQVATPRPSFALSWSDHEGPHRQVIEKDPFEIGSGERAQLRLLEPSVSSRHARIHWDEGHFRVRDMHSQNGTFVNDEAVPLSRVLANGDLLRLGNVRLTVHIGEGGSEAAAKPQAAAKTMISQSPLPQPPAAPRAPVPLPPRPAMPPKPAAPAPRVATPPAPRPAPPPPPPEPEPEPVPEIVKQVPSCLLTWIDAEGRSHEARLEAPNSLLVGRRAEVDLRLTDPSVSGKHCSLAWEGDELVIRDLGSTNGTFVNEEPITRHVLSDGDALKLGLLEMKVAIEHAEGEDEESSSEELEDAEVIDEEEEEELGPPSFHVVYLNDAQEVAVMTLSDRRHQVPVGAGGHGIAVGGRGLLPAHARISWDEGVLIVERVVPSASLEVNGAEAINEVLKNGDEIAAGAFRAYVVRQGVARAHPGRDADAEALVERWRGHLEEENPDLELLFIDTEGWPHVQGTPEAGGRTELCIWGDGVMQLEVFGVGAKTQHMGRAHRSFVDVVVAALVNAGFPDVPVDLAGGRQVAEASEVHAFRGEERADVMVDKLLGQRSAAYAEARDLLRAAGSVLIG